MRPSILRIAVILSFCSSAATGNSGDSSKDENDDMFRGSSFDTSAYDDDNYDYVNGTSVEKWIADDPYFYYPQDDEVLQQLNAEAEAMRAAEAAKAKKSEKTAIDPAAIASVVCFSLAGVAISVFGISVILYYLKLNALMRQYATKGTVADARILASEPDMIDAIEKEEDKDKRGLVHIDGSNGSDETSYAGATTMTMDDDEPISYRQMDTDEYGSDDTDNSEMSKDQSQPATKFNHSQESNDKKAKSRLGRISSLVRQVRQTKILKSEEHYKTQKFQIRRNNPAKESVRGFQKFHALVEYDNLTTVDGSRVRKHLTILGEDVTIIENPLSSRKDFCIKLYVLPKHPISGVPYNEVHRARRCHRFIMFTPCVLLGCVLVVGCLYATFRSTSVLLFAGYIAVLIVQIPLLNCYLGSSFDQVLAASYMEKGMLITAEDAKGAVYGQTLLQSESSFCAA